MIKKSKTPIHGYLPVKKLCKYILGSAQCFKDIFRMAPQGLQILLMSGVTVTSASQILESF